MKDNRETKSGRDKALDEIKELRNRYGENANKLNEENEANTRLVLIDRILEILGWERDDFNPEYPLKSRPGFIDYLITTDGQPRFIIEAKKRGVTFGHPQAGRLKKKVYKFSYLRSAFGQPIGDVIEQAKGYSLSTSVPYAVITNGAEWILMQAIPYGYQTPDSLNCIYFGNILSDESDFDYLWEMLSKPRVLEGNLENHIIDLNPNFSEYCKIPQNQIGSLDWSSLNYSFISDFYDYFLDEITDSARRIMLKHCFVSNTKLDQYQGDLKRVLRDVAPRYMHGVEDIDPDANRSFIPRGSGDKKGRVILVIGSVGCGKSTFITKVLFDARRENRFESIVVNLIDEVKGDPDAFNRFLWSEVMKEWKRVFPETVDYKFLKKAFGREIKDLKRGPRAEIFANNEEKYREAEAELLEKIMEDPQIFLASCWQQYSKTNNKGVVVFIDNVDRASEEYQKLVYAFAHKIARETGITVIITMREVTYFRGKKFGFLDIRTDDKTYHLKSPDIVSILSKRIQYAETQLLVKPKLKESKKEEDYRLRTWRSSPDWAAFLEESKRHLEVLRNTFLTSEHKRELLELLSSVAWHDVRYFLEKLRSLHIMLGSENHSWTVSQVIASLIESAKIEENLQVLPNLFRPIYDNYLCYFLKIRILIYLIYSRANTRNSQGSGFQEISKFARIYRYQDQWILKSLEEMVRERLLECLEVPSAAEYTKDYEISKSHSFRASPLALVMINIAICNSTYLSLIGFKLPFHRNRNYQAFINASRESITLLIESGLNSNSLDILETNKIASSIGAYLRYVYDKEQPLIDMSLYPPEITSTEQKLLQVFQNNDIYSFNEELSIEDRSIKSKQSNQEIQNSLFGDEDILGCDNLTEYENIKPVEVPIPTGFSDNSLKKHGHLPRIFWSMVKLKSQGEEEVTGASITKVINQFLVDDLNTVENTNISRTLRSSSMRSQDWLSTRRISPRKVYYSLNNNWPHMWKEIFSSTPPDIGDTISGS